MTKNKITLRKYNSPVGIIILGCHGNKLCMCDWETSAYHAKTLNKLKRELSATSEEGNDIVLENAVTQLDEYFGNQRKSFTVPLLIVGTEMQKQVWTDLLRVPYGSTATYGSIARRISKPSAVRAVANAVGANPLSLFVPCHRIIGSNGAMTGYRGGIPAKKVLLDLEKGTC